jgi:Asp-tRNA(Asn)/Glu-tRNA(Gln) amidotransferase A subunit family amidase
MMGKLFDDAKLLRAAYALEQATKAWRPPNLR